MSDNRILGIVRVLFAGGVILYALHSHNATALSVALVAMVLEDKLR